MRRRARPTLHVWYPRLLKVQSPRLWQILRKNALVYHLLYINGRNGGLLERMKDIGVDVTGLDWRVDMADGRRRFGDGLSVQGNVDPAYIFSPLPVLTDEIHRVVNQLVRKVIYCTYAMVFLKNTGRSCSAFL